MRGDLPSGTVTFLFTDVEGSTRLLDELGAEGYAAVNEIHRRAVREALARHDGVEVSTHGDAFFAVFTDTVAGVRAAATAQELLADGRLRVRMGLHRGTAVIADDTYVGMDVNRAARIADAGHGGQVLLSPEVRAALGDSFALTDLGEQRLKDLSEPVRLFQLGSDRFPPLRVLYRSTLPVPPTAFLGREHELAEVASLLSREDARLVTLTGPGGTGKTRLALQAAAEASEAFPDGISWVPLAPLREPSLLHTTVAQALEISEEPGVAITETIVKGLAAKRALVVVDNCEHLADEVASLLRTLLEGCPSLVVAASSRERLGLRSERVYPVPPMAPSDGQRLFGERALAVAPGFVADEHVAAICEAVDELPLAIELAAARVRSLSTKAIRERLSERLSLLTSRDRDLDERQRTLEATIAWSNDLLDPDEQRVLRALSVFAGGSTLEAAGAVAGADLDLLESLLDKSLLRHRIDEAGDDRYLMLETIREYAAARLADHEETDGCADAHLAYFVNLAEGFGSGARTAAQFDEFRADRENYRIALLRSIGSRDAATALRIVRYLTYFWHLGGEFADSLAVIRRALDLEGGRTDDRAHALRVGGTFSGYLGDMKQARTMLDEAESLYATLGDTAGLSLVAVQRGFLEATLGNGTQAIAYGERALELAHEVGDEYGISNARSTLVYGLQVAALETDPPEAAKIERALELQLGDLAYTRAAGLAPEQEADMVRDVALTLVLAGRNGEALRYAREAIELLLDRPRRPGHDAETVRFAAYAASGVRSHRQALTLAAWVRRSFSEQGLELQVIDRRLLGRLDADARAALGDEGYDAAVEDGEAMTVDQALELVLSLAGGGSGG
jgi:predicted ATPase/class 3 adenylate cyclase